MFGFGKDKSEKKIDEAERTSRWTAMYNTFGTTHVDDVLKEYMPEITDAIFEAKRASLNIEGTITKTICQNQVNVNENINLKHNELMEELKALREQNQESERRNRELQEKYNALVERMASILERESGKGR